MRIKNPATIINDRVDNRMDNSMEIPAKIHNKSARLTVPNHHHSTYDCQQVTTTMNKMPNCQRIFKNLKLTKLCNHHRKLSSSSSSNCFTELYHKYYNINVMNIIVIFIISSLIFTTNVCNGQLYNISCPHVNLISRLTSISSSSSSASSSASSSSSIAPECDCTLKNEGGWEITCFLSGNSDLLLNSYDNIDDTTSTSANNANDADEDLHNGWIINDEFDYGGEIPIAFIVKYNVQHHTLKIECDKGVPAFKSALFQGFEIDRLDNFVISNCELPQNLPISFILDRTRTTTSSIQNARFHLTSTVGQHSYTINTTTDPSNYAQFDTLPSIKTLVIKSRNRVSVKQLNTLLSDLQSLEELQLTDFNLSDVDNYSIETYEYLNPSKSSSINGFNINHSNKRTKRENLVDDNDIEDMTTEMPTTISPLNSETTTLLSDNDLTTVLPALVSLEPLGRSLSLSENGNESLLNDEFNINDTSMTSFDDNNRNESVLPVTTTIHPLKLIDDNTNSIANHIESDDMIINVTSSSTASDSVDDNLINSSIENDLIIENQQQLVVKLDQNALNFARILPNLRDLRLKNFIQESKISNVLFQIINGLQKLEFLELRSNNLRSVPSNAFVFAANKLKKLYLSHNLIEHIDPDAFHNLTNLEILDLSHNNLIELDASTFKSLKNLQFLTMFRNEFRHLNENLFKFSKKIVSLDISQNNQLEPLPAQIFNGLTSLSNLSLAHCNLTAISTDTREFFRNIPNLLSLNLRRNQLKNLTINGLFAWNAKLSKIDLSSNRIEKISADIFTINSTEIIELNLDKNRLQELPENLFIEARKIRKLSISANQLEQITPMTFMVLRELEQLDLSYNKIKTLNTMANKGLPFGLGGYLRKINLSFNELSDYYNDIVQIEWILYLHLAEMNLRNNKFNGTFEIPNRITSLETQLLFDISNNQFDSINIDNIMTMLSISDDSQSSIMKETIVRLDNNPLRCDCHLFPFLNYTKSIGRLYGKHFDTIYRKVIFLIDSNPKTFCNGPQNLQNRTLDNLKLNELICPIEDDRICPQQCQCKYRSSDQTSIIDCDNRNFSQMPSEIDISQYFNITLNDSKIIPSVQGVIFQLRDNKIQMIDNLDPMIKWTNNITDDDYNHKKLKPLFVEILLDRNNLTNIEWKSIDENQTTDSLILIKKFSLQNNQLERIPMPLLDNFNTLVEANQANLNRIPTRTIKPRLYLGNNPINCYNEPLPPGSECYLRTFKQWLSSHPNLIADVNLIKCNRSTIDFKSKSMMNQTSNMIIVNMNDELLCPVLIPPASNTALMALSIACVVLASSLFVVSILYYRNKQTILAFIYIHLNPIFICLNFTENDLDEDKIYDAFVSYSSADRDLVMELIEKLEKPQNMSELNNLILQNGSAIGKVTGDQIVQPENVFKSATLKSSKDIENGDTDNQTYKLCIHERDWLPGNLISWNIVNSVQNSKRTILILSENFINSIWFQVEFHTAYYQMLEDKIDRLIVIVRGDLPPKDQLDKDLNFLLTTKTYLVWGEKWFWEKLYYAMPHKKPSRRLKNQSEKDKLQPSNQIKYNDTFDARKNDISSRWSHSNNNNNHNHKSNAKTEAMKQYVDQTIASHFQLNSFHTSSSNHLNHDPNTTVKAAQQNQQSSLIANGSNNNQLNDRPTAKSLRNSGTLATATPNVLKEFNGVGGGIDNKSFIDETNT